jgi:hypothetical protein
MAAGGTVSLAGCSEQTNFSTEPTGLTESDRQAFNYQISSYDPYQAERTIDVGPLSQNIRMLLHVSFYQSEDSTSIENLSGVGFITLPTQTIAGRSINPLSSADPEEIVSLFAQTNSQFDADDIEVVDTYQQPFDLTGSSTEVTEFRTQVSSSIVDIYLRIHVASVQIAEDTEVYALGFHVEGQDQARETIQTAFQRAVNPSEELQARDVEPKPLQDLIGGSLVSQ